MNLLGPHVGRDSPSISVQDNQLQDSSGIGIVNYPFGLLMGFELGSPLGDMLYSETWTNVGLQLIVYIPPGSKVRYPDLMGSPLQATPAMPPSRSC